MRNRTISVALVFFLSLSLISSQALGFGLKSVFKNLHVNTTNPGNYQDAASGYWSGGGAAIRTKSTAIQPFSISPPSLSHGCNGIDAFIGAFSMISGGELVSMANNIGSQAAVYGFHLGMKTYAPQIEQVLKDLRNLSMELNQMGIGHCKTVQAGFAAVLPQNSAMYETVCNEMAAGSGNDLGGQRKKCKDHLAEKAAAAKKQDRDPEVMMDNFNIFIKAAIASGIPKEMHAGLMSMVGTIVVKDEVVIPYPSLANDAESWNTHINGGSDASMYSCDNATCLNITINNKVTIKESDSYAGKAKTKLKGFAVKVREQTAELTTEEKGFLDSLGTAFPIFDHITLEAVSGLSVLDADSQLIARYMLMSHLEKVTSDIKRGVYYLKNKQMTTEIIKDYEASLDKLLQFANREWNKVMSDADRVNARADKIWKHVMARERG
jgi:conjugative transfer pilus assembly protein TraH